MNDRIGVYPDMDMEELKRISSHAVELAEKEKDKKDLDEARREQEYLEQNMIANSDLASRVISTLSEKCNQQAKHGRRKLEMISLVQDDMACPIRKTPARIENTSVFKNGSAVSFLAYRLLEAGFKLETKVSGKELILILKW